jgi:hypothetical protein
MTDLKLRKLPDRTPVKLTVSIQPELSKALSEYAAVYADTYGEREPVAALVPAMLSSFLETDRTFQKARKALNQAPPKHRDR